MVKNKVSLTTSIVAMATNFEVTLIDLNLFIGKSFTKLCLKFNLSVIGEAAIECQRWECEQIKQIIAEFF